MNRQDLAELHYITPIDNVPSILQQGILSHKRAAPLQPSSVAMQKVQDIRAGKAVPGGRKLHEYVNLYICARNPMLFLRKDQHADLCVLRVSTTVLDLPGVIVTDGNAASDYVRFAAAPDGLSIVDRDRTFAEYWTDPDQVVGWRKKAAKCAEVLVPDRVGPCHLTGAYVSCEQAKAKLEALGTGLPIAANGYLFFV